MELIIHECAAELCHFLQLKIRVNNVLKSIIQVNIEGKQRLNCWTINFAMLSLLWCMEKFFYY